MDLCSGVATLEALHCQPDAGTVDSLPLSVEGYGGSCAAGTGHGEDALLLAVQVDEGPAPETGQVDGIGTQHPDLLVHGDDDFQRGMRDGGICQQGQGEGQGNAVIATKSGALGKDKLAVMGQVQTIHGHIQGTVGLLLADHVHMALKDHRGMVLQALGTRPEEDDIIYLVLDVFESVGLGKGYQIVADGLGVAAPVGDGADLFKIA